MKDTTKKMIDNEIINRMHYVINCDDDRKFQDNIRRDHYNYLSGFVSSLFHNGNMTAVTSFIIQKSAEAVLSQPSRFGGM